MGMTHKEYLASTRVFGCLKCKTHLATIENMISKQFNGQHGRAFLFDNVVNVWTSSAEDRHMTTGLYTVRDISCVKCNTVVGWTYVRAFTSSEKFKEGKFILEKTLITDVQ